MTIILSNYDRYASMSRFNFIPNSVISPTWCDVSTFDHVMFCFYNINLQYFICTRFRVVSLLREACDQFARVLYSDDDSSTWLSSSGLLLALYVMCHVAPSIH